ncbi:cell division protein ZapE [Methylobrevis albus]|uniref:AFG1 family ATPase n=1 Tax=Methylobrevis albus TaxID=2793297 RepID=A0A931N0D7_9HYPH|nr:cell division protein ZapE [Methylobrevis albus]MBH0238691.1 AFG1 family ATPase [Methylobrevis albus]
MTAEPRASAFDESHTLRTVTGAYDALAAAGSISPDRAQRAVAHRLDALAAALKEAHLASKKSALGWLFGRKSGSGPSPIRGAYVWGSVGRGKTMLMDLFVGLAEEPKKRRVHFLEFMAEVHERIHAARKAGEKDPVEVVAAAIAAEVRLLCFDEFSVTDIADAMILGRLFGKLFDRGLVLVATSNVAPDDLYRDGLNRGHFMPFVAMLKQRVDVLNLDSPTDYRLEKLGAGDVYLTPLGPETDAAFRARWRDATIAEPSPALLEVKGRKVRVPAAADGAARFSFDDLCVQPLGGLDYQAIVRAYHTVFVEHVPVMDRTRRNDAKRFILLIDTLYDTGTKLVVSAAAEPDGLYTDSSGTEGFEFARCASRLIEMRSDAYLASPRRLDAIRGTPAAADEAIEAAPPPRDAAV